MKRAILVGSLLATYVIVGCGGPTEPEPKAEAEAETKTKVVSKPGKTKADDHSGWWCEPHGIPEHQCLKCLLGETELKKRKDWCEEHEIAKSQCFKCNAKLRERFAAQYRAKYGKEPPPADEN